jgi:hypothetical protein
MAPRKKSTKSSTAPAAGSGGFVGRDPSPVLDKYPPKDPALSPRGPGPVADPPAPPAPVAPAGVPAATPAVPVPSPSTTSAPAANAPVASLITLERPFNVDEFSSLLGETSIRVTVPRDDLTEVLRRVVDFMGFGIYVYSVSVRPVPSDLLKAFVVELRRVDYSATDREWVPFVEKGASDSPFGPTGTRT